MWVHIASAVIFIIVFLTARTSRGGRVVAAGLWSLVFIIAALVGIIRAILDGHPERIPGILGMLAVWLFITGFVPGLIICGLEWLGDRMSQRNPARIPTGPLTDFPSEPRPPAPKVYPFRPRESCPKCGKPLRHRIGRYGAFLGCSGYPECTFTKSARRH